MKKLGAVLAIFALALAVSAQQPQLLISQKISAGATPIALIMKDQASATAGSTATTVGGFDSTGGNFAAIYQADGEELAFGSTCGDSKGNIYTPLNDYGGSGLSRAGRWWYVANPTVGAGHNFSCAGYYNTLFAYVFSNVKTASSPFDQQNGAVATQPGSITPSENNELVLTGYVDQGTGALSINGGFSSPDTQRSASYISGGASYLIQTTAAAANPTWSGGTTDKAVSIASFKHN